MCGGSSSNTAPFQKYWFNTLPGFRYCRILILLFVGLLTHCMIYCTLPLCTLSGIQDHPELQQVKCASLPETHTKLNSNDTVWCGQFWQCWDEQTPWESGYPLAFPAIVTNSKIFFQDTETKWCITCLLTYVLQKHPLSLYCTCSCIFVLSDPSQL